MIKNVALFAAGYFWASGWSIASAAIMAVIVATSWRRLKMVVERWDEPLDR